MKIIKWFFLILMLAGIAVFAANHFAENSGKKIITWRTEKVTRGDITQSVSVSGTLNPREMVTVSTQVTGMVSNITVAVNDSVTKGQLLAEIDPTLLLTQLKQSQSNLESARFSYERAVRDLERTRLLLAKDYVAKVELERAEEAHHSALNSYENAKTQVERDETNLGYTKIVSPIDGVVALKDVDVGQTVISSTAPPRLFVIAGDFRRMKIEVTFSEADIAQIKVGMPVTFTVDAFPGRQFTGKVQTINLTPVPNQQQGAVTYTAAIAVENEDRSLLPGMTAYINILLFEKKDILRVPGAAIRFTMLAQAEDRGLKDLLQMGENTYTPGNNSAKQVIYLLRGEKVVPVPVNMGAMDDSYVEISGEGIQEGDLVITGIQQSRKPGL